MSGEQRKSLRKVLKYPARIDVGDGTLRPCALRDISQAGARILYTASDNVPDRFVLLLSGRAGAVRHCQVVWRKGGEIGIEFLKMPVERPSAPAGLAPPPRRGSPARPSR